MAWRSFWFHLNGSLIEISLKAFSTKWVPSAPFCFPIDLFNFSWIHVQRKRWVLVSFPIQCHYRLRHRKNQFQGLQCHETLHQPAEKISCKKKCKHHHGVYNAYNTFCKLPWSELEVPTSTQSSCCGWISLSTCSRGLEAKPRCNWNLKTGKGLMKHSIFIPKMFQAFLQFSNKSESNQDISFSMETMFPLSNRNKPGPLPSFHAKLHLCEQKGQTPTTTRVVHLTNARAPTFWA